MKKRLSIAFAFAVLFGGVLIAMPQAYAVSSFETKDTGEIVQAKGAVHDGSYYVAGQDITINGTIKGDLYCAGQTVRINGTVDGDVICAAQTITINGVVGHDARVASQMLTVAGSVGGTLTSFAQDVTLAKGATIGADLNGAAQSITIDGTVGRDLAVGAQKLTIAGVVKGSATVTVETLALSSQPSIMGGLEYTDSQKQTFTKGSVVGEVKFHQAESSEVGQQNAFAAMMTAFMFFAFALVVSSLIISLVIPRTLERSYVLTRKRIGTALLVGVAVSMGLPVLALICMISVIGLPLGLLLVAMLALVHLLAFPFAAYYLGRVVFGQVVHHVVALMLAGALLLCVLLFIPIVNIVTFLVIMVVGVGGVVTTVTNGYRRPHYGLVTDVSKKSKK